LPPSKPTIFVIRYDANNAPTIVSSGDRTAPASAYNVQLIVAQAKSYGFAGGGFGVRHEGGSEEAAGFGRESSGLENTDKTQYLSNDTNKGPHISPQLR
jgi:hypothetical protein